MIIFLNCFEENTRIKYYIIFWQLLNRQKHNSQIFQIILAKIENTFLHFKISNQCRHITEPFGCNLQIRVSKTVQQLHLVDIQILHSVSPSLVWLSIKKSINLFVGSCSFLSFFLFYIYPVMKLIGSSFLQFYSIGFRLEVPAGKRKSHFPHRCQK